MINGQRLTITTGSLNRLEHLRKSLATWLAHPEIDEIVIVDWDNEDPLLQSLNDFTDPRIIVAKAENQKHWHNSKCHNLELQLATGEQILRLDNDYLLGQDFFSRHELRSGCFFAGNWQTTSGDQRHLSGAVYAYKSDLLSVNGYNERLLHYGREDDDLYDRLVAGGLRRVGLDLATITHIPHSHVQRYEHLKIAGKIPSLPGKISEQQREKVAEQVVLNLIRISCDIAVKKPWTTRDHVTKWKTDALSPNYVTCEEIPKEIPEKEIEEALTYIDSPLKPFPVPAASQPPSRQRSSPPLIKYDSPSGIIVANHSFGRGLASNVNVH